MSFVDMAFLRKSDLSEGHLVYRRRKTNRLLSIQWTPEMQSFIEKYPPKIGPYLLPILGHRAGSPECAYRNEAYRINRCLKRVGRMINLSFPLTMYCARHSWASTAKMSGIPLSVISEGMGHESERTTRIYLASLSAKVIDRANSVVISMLGLAGRRVAIAEPDPLNPSLPESVLNIGEGRW